ncbi:hypothetical protein ACCO45_013544 [Purpureocillium lilacinum]|uniref:Uncharacterized protein n=1 Tax=Purpureocillium lilacinum TaxID=33203 RepID=A0ACC4D7S5_PURLI
MGCAGPRATPTLPASTRTPSSDATKDASKAARACPRESADFERDRAAAWVKYFKQWRVADVQKKRRLEELRRQGAQEMEVSTSFAPDGGAAEKGKGRDDIQGMLDQKRR